jgi:hypothetical protein
LNAIFFQGAPDIKKGTMDALPGFLASENTRPLSSSPKSLSDFWKFKEEGNRKNGHPFSDPE